MTAYKPRKNDIVEYNGWTCRVPFDDYGDSTQIDLIRIPHGTWTPDVHVSRLKLISRDSVKEG